MNNTSSEVDAYIERAARFARPILIKLRKLFHRACPQLEAPDYIMAALRRNKQALATFQGFSYSHRKEYIEWITEAKREETRKVRLAAAIEMLAEGKSRHWNYQK